MKSLIVLGAFLLGAGWGLASDNLIKNGNFADINADGSVAAWHIWPEPPHPTASAAPDTTVSWSAGRSIRIAQARMDTYTRIQQLHIPCKPHTKYIASFRAKGSNLCSATSGGARLFIGADGELNTALTSFGPGIEWLRTKPKQPWSFDWKYYQSDVFDSGKSTTLGVTAYLYYCSGIVWFDNIEIIEYTPDIKARRMETAARELLSRDEVQLKKLAPELAAEFTKIVAAAKAEDLKHGDSHNGMPFFPVQRELGRIFSRHLQAVFPNRKLVVSAVRDPLAPQSAWLVPTADTRLALYGLGGELEGFAVNLTNTGNEDQKVSFKPDEAFDARLVTHVETDRRTAVDDALVRLLPAGDGNCQVTVPPGMTRQIYFTVRMADKPGAIHRELVFNTPDGEQRIDLELCAAAEKFPKTLPIRSFSWNYPVAWQLERYNPIAATVGTLARQHENVFIMEQFSMPHAAFDTQGNIAPGTMDWSKLERQKAMVDDSAVLIFNFPVHDEAHIAFMLGEGNGKNIPVYSAEWERRIIEYVRALVAGCRERGIGYDRLFVTLYDEPGPNSVEYIERLAKILRKADSRLKLLNNFNNSFGNDGIARLAAAMDVVMPELNSMSAEKMRILRESGKEIWTYHVQSRNYPGSSMRDNFRFLWQQNAVGFGYWCFFDRYPEWRPDGPQSYSVVYNDGSDEWVLSKRSEGIREGVEDYTALKILDSHDPKKAAALADANLPRDEFRKQLFSIVK